MTMLRTSLKIGYFGIATGSGLYSVADYNRKFPTPKSSLDQSMDNVMSFLGGALFGPPGYLLAAAAKPFEQLLPKKEPIYLGPSQEVND